MYESPEDVDLTVGGSLEKIVPGTLAGPTFLCILTEQFYRSRVGDRFWFENGHHGSPFTIGKGRYPRYCGIRLLIMNDFFAEQLNEIRKSSISRLLCDNAHHVEALQPRGFERISEQ